MEIKTGNIAMTHFFDSAKETFLEGAQKAFLDGIENSFLDNLMLKWQEDIPPYCPELALEAVNVAKSYRDAVDNNYASFVYSGGATFLDDGVVKDSDGMCRIDCSTYIHLVMRGIDYEHSPYAMTLPENNFPAEDLITNWAYSWADDSLRASRTLSNALRTHEDGKLVRFAADLAAYYWAGKRVFPYTAATLDYVKPGDLVFYSRSDKDRFMHISHVGIVLDNNLAGYEDNVLRMYNVMNSDNDNAPVVTISRVQQENRTIAFFARPDYAGTARHVTLPGTNYLDAPWSFNISDGKAKSNVLVTPNYQAGTIWTGTDGVTEVNDETLIILFDSKHPFYLPAGTYHLSGAPAHPDIRSEYGRTRWGLRVYPFEGERIPFSQTGLEDVSVSTTQTKTDSPTGDSYTKIWDVGFGADFTLSSGRWMRASIYISSTPDGSNAYSNLDPAEDIWRPTLIRTA